VKLFYSSSYTLAGHDFPTTRKSGWIAESLASQPIPSIEIQTPVPATEEQLLLVHSAEYMEAVRTGKPRYLAESQGFTWDPGLWEMVLASTGGTIAAALAAMRDGVAGSLSSGLHHARRDTGVGYCTFNGLAIAAQAALDAGAVSVLILDLDAHCGGGTHSLVAHDPRIWHTDIAVNSFDRYEPDERGSLSILDNARSNLPEITRQFHSLEERAQRFDLCLYNAGMDPYEGCPIGGLPGISREMLKDREELLFTWAHRRAMPIAFVLAGGYIGPRLDQETLVGLHRLTLAAAARTQ
jgi:acetoin utilization deacetylase AcuC-like enzyme